MRTYVRPENIPNRGSQEHAAAVLVRPTYDEFGGVRRGAQAAPTLTSGRTYIKASDMPRRFAKHNERSLRHQNIYTASESIPSSVAFARKADRTYNSTQNRYTCVRVFSFIHRTSSLCPWHEEGLHAADVSNDTWCLPASVLGDLFYQPEHSSP